MTDLLDEELSEKPCGCNEGAVSESLGEGLSLDELEAAIAAVEAEPSAAPELEPGEDLEFAVFEEGAEELMMTPPAAEAAVTLGDLMGLLENYPGLKVTISF